MVPPEVLLATADYRSKAVLAQLSQRWVEVIVALGRESKSPSEIDADKCPHTTAMAAKLQNQEGRENRRRKGHREGTQCLDQVGVEIQAVQLQGHRESLPRGQARVRGAESAAHGGDGGLKGTKSRLAEDPVGQCEA
ncbi:hypothetical protein [Paucibacter sp. B51]|uniref:hypothetical protein n=1 Tax=Paucibacter sp. B51 TaxID=2993315 RepID=UPI0022EBE490|nr:hypothetical protein [Paucibacter sp. B51]